MKNVKWVNNFNTVEYKSYKTFDNFCGLGDGAKCGVIEYRKWERRYTAKRIAKNEYEERSFFNTLKEAKSWVATWICA